MRALIAALSAAVLLPLAALADDGAHCRKLRARAATEAALLMSPQLVVQGLRFPHALALSELDGASLTPYQARAGLAFAPLDLVKGLALTRAAEAECAQDQAQATLESFLLHAEASARLPALRSQVRWLEETAPAWRALRDREEDRFERHLITLFELHQLRARTAVLERQLVQASGEAERLAAEDWQRPAEAPPVLLQQSFSNAVQLERELAGARSLSFWSVRLSAGLVASERPLDWYGLAELTVRLGAPWQGGFEREVVAARAEELHRDRRGLETRVQQLQHRLALLDAQARRELALLDAQLASVAAAREALEGAEAAHVAFARSLLSCDQWVAESERTYLTAYLAALSSLLREVAHG